MPVLKTWDGTKWVPVGTPPEVLGVYDDTGWQYPTLSGTWQTYGGGFTVPRYRRINGIVYIEGLVKNTSGGSTIFVLPVGYRPAGGTQLFAVEDDQGPNGRVDVDVAGNVVHNTGTTGFVSLSTIRFPAGDYSAPVVLTPTGTKDTTTFLRGDNTWAVPPGSGGGAGSVATATTGLDLNVANTAPASPSINDLWVDADEPSPSASDFQWQTYTPTLTNWYIGTTGASIVGRYAQVGKTVHFRIVCVLGTSFTISGGAVFSLPVAMASNMGSNKFTGIANATFTDVGSNNFMAYPLFTSTQVYLYVPGTNGAATNPTYTLPFTWVAGDYIDIAGTYEAA